MSGIQMCDIFYDQYNARLLDFYQFNKLKSFKKNSEEKTIENLWALANNNNDNFAVY